MHHKLQHEHDRVEKQTEDGKGGSKLQHEHDRVEKQTDDGKGGSKLQHEHERVEKQTEAPPPVSLGVLCVAMVRH